MKYLFYLLNLHDSLLNYNVQCCCCTHETFIEKPDLHNFQHKFAKKKKP